MAYLRMYLGLHPQVIKKTNPHTGKYLHPFDTFWVFKLQLLDDLEANHPGFARQGVQRCSAGLKGLAFKGLKRELEPEISWIRLTEQSFLSFVYLSLGSILAYNHSLQVSSSIFASPTRSVPWRRYSQGLQTFTVVSGSGPHR